MINIAFQVFEFTTSESRKLRVILLFDYVDLVFKKKIDRWLNFLDVSSKAYFLINLIF
jgi:hypothetical protein